MLLTANLIHNFLKFLSLLKVALRHLKWAAPKALPIKSRSRIYKSLSFSKAEHKSFMLASVNTLSAAVD